MTSLFNSLAGGGEEPMIDNSCGLSRTQRLWAFGSCFVGGMVLSIIGSIFFAFANVKGFAVCYSLGSIMSLCSTMFLFGPWGQLKRMFDKDRWIATTVYLSSIVLTIVFATTVCFQSIFIPHLGELHN